MIVGNVTAREMMTLKQRAKIQAETPRREEGGFEHVATRARSGAVRDLTAAPASASDWPTRTVTVVVPYAPGGFTDTLARLAAKHMADKFHQPFVIENRLGAAGAIAAGYVANAAPDGYTVMFASASQLGVSPLIKRCPNDPDAFAPVSVFGTIPFLMGIKASLPAKTVPEFCRLCESQPGQAQLPTAPRRDKSSDQRGLPCAPASKWFMCRTKAPPRSRLPSYRARSKWPGAAFPTWRPQIPREHPRARDLGPGTGGLSSLFRRSFIAEFYPDSP